MKFLSSFTKWDLGEEESFKSVYVCQRNISYSVTQVVTHNSDMQHWCKGPYGHLLCKCCTSGGLCNWGRNPVPYVASTVDRSINATLVAPTWGDNLHTHVGASATCNVSPRMPTGSHPCASQTWLGQGQFWEGGRPGGSCSWVLGQWACQPGEGAGLGPVPMILRAQIQGTHRGGWHLPWCKGKSALAPGRLLVPPALRWIQHRPTVLAQGRIAPWENATSVWVYDNLRTPPSMFSSICPRLCNRNSIQMSFCEYLL